MLIITKRYPTPLPEVKDFSHLAHKSDKELLEWMLEEVKNGLYLNSNGVPKSSFLYTLLKNQIDIISVIEYLSRNIEQNIDINKSFRVLREYNAYEKEHLPICQHPECSNQVTFFVNSRGGNKTNRIYCSKSCSMSHNASNSKYKIDEETGLPISVVKSRKGQNTMKNGIDKETGLNLRELRNKRISENRLETDPETGLSNAAIYAQKETDRRYEEYDPNSGLPLVEEYFLRSLEGKCAIKEDGLDGFERTKIVLEELYQTERGKEIKKKRTRNQRATILKLKKLKDVTDLDEKERFKIYRKRVKYETEINDLTLLSNHEKRDKHTENEEAYHLDHIYSVAHGFENNIPPYIIGNIKNLQFIHWKENLSKNSDSWMTKDELFEKVLDTNF